MISSHQQKGMILPLTLIIIALLTMMAGILLSGGQELIEDARNSQNEWQAELKIKSAEQRVLFALMAGEQLPGGYLLGDLQIRTDGTPLKLSNGVWVSIQDQAGLLSLRFLRKEWLIELFKTYVDDTLARQIVNNIIVYQTPKGKTTSETGDGDFFQRNALMRSIDELMLIPGVSADIYNGCQNLNLDKQEINCPPGLPEFGLRDLLTLSGSSELNYLAIPNELLSRVLKFSPESIKQIDKLKERANWSGVFTKFAALGWPNAALNAIPSSRYIIRFQYNGIQARGDYQVRSTMIPPRIRMWYFPDRYRYFVKPN